MILPLLIAVLVGKELEVGPGRQFAHVADAVKSSKPGDTILVYPSPDKYKGEAVRVRVPNLTIRGKGQTPVLISGEGFEYSGQGTVPRAIIQIEPEASGTTIQNLDLSDAHNNSFNGAAIRIQAASNVTITNCVIHDNDMGIMSNGKEGDPKAASDQMVEFCLIEKNGNKNDPGYNHNLYLGGTSAHIYRCEIRNSLTGHNIKSRAHYIEIEECYIHDAANREIDLPDSWDTSRPNSNALIIGNRIVKDPDCPGNRGVIHFGKEKGTRIGNIYLFENIIVTPFASPMVTVTTPGSTIVASTNIFINKDQGKAELWAGTKRIFAKRNYWSPGYGNLTDNTTFKTRSETMGLNPPKYAFQERFTMAHVSWVNGEGVNMTIEYKFPIDFLVGATKYKTGD